MEKLFEKYSLGDLNLNNRMVMAPMTRSRASFNGVQSKSAIEYYGQRASAGLIITEGSQVSPQGVGYIKTPGIYNTQQMSAWSKVVERVHKNKGKIFLQLWHVGRVSHPDFHEGKPPVAPSAIPFEGEVYTKEGMKKTVTPRALEINEIEQIVEQFYNASRLAKEAGFDGIEIHGANGYLLDQFLRDGTNKRTDKYGGSLENRFRLPLEVIKAVSENFSLESIGYRISPNNSFHGMSDSNTVETFSEFTKRLNKLGLGYLHIFEYIKGHEYGPSDDQTFMTPILRKLFKNAYIVNGGYQRKESIDVISRGEADLVAFGVPFLANPDLVERFIKDKKLNIPDQDTFYQGGDKGYIDYPFLDG